MDGLGDLNSIYMALAVACGSPGLYFYNLFLHDYSFILDTVYTHPDAKQRICVS